MTKLGKLLVFINLALSVGMAALALGLYSNRIEWAGAKPGEAEGELTRLANEIKNQQGLFGPTVQRWLKEKTDLERQEALQARSRAFYAKQLELVVKGKGAGQPIDLLDFDTTGKLKIGADGMPVMKPASDRNLRGLEPQLQALRVIEGQIAQEITATQGIIEQTAALTRQLNGTPGRQPPGLRALLAEMQTAEKRAAEELLYVKRERINTREAAASVVNRQRQLREREETLKKQKVAMEAQ